MTNPKAPIDEWKRTFIEAATEKGYTGSMNVEAGLLAVIEKHVADMVQGYYEDGFNDGYAPSQFSKERRR